MLSKLSVRLRDSGFSVRFLPKNNLECFHGLGQDDGRKNCSQDANQTSQNLAGEGRGEKSQGTKVPGTSQEDMLLVCFAPGPLVVNLPRGGGI